jgi:hypothetical protein
MHWVQLNTFCRQLGIYFRREGMTFRNLCPSYSKLTKLLVSLNFFLWALSVISLLQVGADFPIDELCISKSLLLNLPGKEEGPKPGNFPVLLLRRGDFSELKSFLLQVDQAIGISQLFLMGTLGNFTLS